MQIVERKLSEIKPYDRNPRSNDEAVQYVKNSIQEFGFKVPIVIDENGIIVCGHTRYKAAIKLHMKTVPCIVADDLTPEQIKAYRLADNKTAEAALWDFGLLETELQDLKDVFDMSEFNFDIEFDFGKKDHAEDDQEPERSRTTERG